MRMFVWPVKFSRSVGESLDARGRRGVASSSSVMEFVLERSCNGRCVAPGVFTSTEFRSCLDGDHGSRADFVGEFRRLAKRVRSVGIAEILLRSPTVSSKAT